MRRSCITVSLMNTLLLLACTLIMACGGGGIADLAAGGQGGTGVTGGGQGGTGMSAGTVTAFGSIYVNGVRYDTSNAEVFVEGQSMGIGDSAVLANLAVGMVVRVEGGIEDSENGTADRVYFNDDLRGPVEVGSFQVIDSTTAQVDVLGKTVIINELTNVDGVSIDASIEGNWLQVSGFEDAEGRLQATFATGSDVSAELNLKGEITNVDTLNRTITVNNLVIRYLGADLIGINQLMTGELVEVTGFFSGNILYDIQAERIEQVDLLGTADIDSIELEGIISAKTSATDFMLNGVPISLDALTIYSGGDADDIAEDVRAEVEGQLINGTLFAERVIFLDFAKVESDVATNFPSVITLHGLMDIPIRYNDLTKVTGVVTSTDFIDENHHVKVIGRRLPATESETMLAVHVITKDTLNNKVILQGALESDPPLNQTTLSLLGHTVDISGIADGDFESPGGTGYAAFYASTEAGDIVSAKGTRSGNNITWQSITVE